MLSWWSCNCDKPRAWKVGIESHTKDFGQVLSSSQATRPNYGSFWSPKNAILHHMLTIYWSSWCCCNFDKPRAWKVEVGMPYNIFWSSLVIQAGHWDQLWVISEPKMPIFHHMLTIHWSYLDCVATVTSPENVRLRLGFHATYFGKVE